MAYLIFCSSSIGLCTSNDRIGELRMDIKIFVQTENIELVC